jgi:hypothetical protein
LIFGGHNIDKPEGALEWRKREALPTLNSSRGHVNIMISENQNKPSEGFFQTNPPVGKSTLAVHMRFYAQAIVIAITFYILS